MQGDEGMSEEPTLRDALDERIDAALRRYAEAPEFADPRVALARVRMLAEQSPRRRVWVWAVPAAVAALIALAAVVWVAQKPVAPQIAFVPKAPGVAGVETSTDSQRGKEGNAGPSTAVARATSAQDDRGLGAAAPQSKQVRRSSVQAPNEVVVAEHRLPKLEVFPTPQALTEQEQVLLAVATKAPPDVRKQVVEAQEHLGDPIQIAAIEIRPLSEDEEQAAPKGKDMR